MYTYNSVLTRDIICINCVNFQMPIYEYAVILFEDEESVAIVHAS